MPMERPPPEDMMHDLFPAKYTTQYLETYVDRKSHNDGTLRDRINFNTEVLSVRKSDAGEWIINSKDTKSSDQKAFRTKRLMVANGQTSAPRIPHFKGQETFKGPIVHSLDFGQSNVIKDEKVQHVAVLGAGKSAADMVYESVKAGKTVSWIIRRSDEGLGPAAFAPIDLSTPYKNGVEASQARIMASLQPSFLIPNRSWWTWFLHSTSLGEKLVRSVFDFLDTTVRKYAGYKERKSDKGFEKLEYETPIFWQNGTAGACHYADFFPLVAEKVHVYRASVKALTEQELYLDDSEMTHFPCDALLLGTGWKQGLDIFDNELRISLGLPFDKKLETDESRAKWEKLVAEADEDVVKRFRMLRNPPKHHHIYEQRTPYRLYQTMAPLNDDTILFMNFVTAGAKLFSAEAQAIWAVAYWDKKIELPPVEAREKDIAHWVAWNKRRYLSMGELGNFAAFDSVPYVDRLFDEIGVKAHRSKGLLGNMFAPIKPPDLGKVWAEYLKSQREG